MTQGDCLSLVDYTGRQIRADKRGAIEGAAPAALMRLGAMSTLGAEAPPNLIHLLLDNEVHESTGAQATTSTTTDLAAVAAACGYPGVTRSGSTADLRRAVETAQGLTFIHCRIRPGGSAGSHPGPQIPRNRLRDLRRPAQGDEAPGGVPSSQYTDGGR